MNKIYKIAWLAVLVVAIAGSLFVKFSMAKIQKAEHVNIASEIQVKEMSVERGKEVIMYYFHTTFRCVSCRKIEQYTEEAINEHFDRQLESGELIFKVVNVENKENKHFMQDYQLYTKSVVLSLVKDGKEIKFKNLDKVWQYLNNKDKFYKYIKEETQKFLDEVTI